tara:strand:- start:266 stop:643 length:378 start_codon:yes stop_codon:yes gene_type:complete
MVVEIVSSKIEALFPSIRIDKAVLSQSLREIKSSSQHFYREKNGSVLAATTDNMPFSTRKQCSLSVWIGEGDGVILFRQWMTWVRSRKAIRLATVTLMFDDPRADRFLLRSGFRRLGGVYVWERG